MQKHRRELSANAVEQYDVTCPILLLVPNFAQVFKRSKSSRNSERLAGIEHFFGRVQNFWGQNVDDFVP